MKNIVLTSVICFILTLTAHAQCTATVGYQCVPRADMDRISKDLAELKNSRTLITALQAQVSALQLTSSDKDALIVKLKEVISIDAMIADSKDKYMAILTQIDHLKDDLIVQLNKKIANNKSFLAKLLTKIEIAYYILSTALLIAK